MCFQAIDQAVVDKFMTKLHKIGEECAKEIHPSDGNYQHEITPYNILNLRNALYTKCSKFMRLGRKRAQV